MCALLQTTPVRKNFRVRFPCRLSARRRITSGPQWSEIKGNGYLCYNVLCHPLPTTSIRRTVSFRVIEDLQKQYCVVGRAGWISRCNVEIRLKRKTVFRVFFPYLHLTVVGVSSLMYITTVRISILGTGFSNLRIHDCNNSIITFNIITYLIIIFKHFMIIIITINNNTYFHR